MAGEYVEDPDDEFDYFEDWKEVGDTMQPGGGGHAGVSDQEEVLVGVIPFNKVRSARRYFLGYSYCDDGPPYGLYREPPAMHPVSPSLRAYTFSAQGFVPASNDDNENGEAYLTSPFLGADGQPMYYFGYQKALVTVRFRSWGRVRFLPDSDIGDYSDEWKRWVEYSAAPSFELLQADAGANLKFAEGPGSNPDPTKAAAFPVPVPTPVAKSKLVIRWYNVPHDYVSDDPVILNPVKIAALLGKVNGDTFLGYDPGTVAMLEAPTFEPALFPVQNADPTDLPLGGYNITIPLSVFDPPKQVPGSAYRGHNLMPWQPTGLWALATRTGDPEDPPLLPSTPFIQLFQHQADPSTP